MWLVGMDVGMFIVQVGSVCAKRSLFQINLSPHIQQLLTTSHVPNNIKITGPAKSGYFQWMQDEDTGEMKPVTRLKKKNIERNPSYWDRAFDKNNNKEE